MTTWHAPTMREAARVADDRADALRRECRCPLHGAIVDELRALAATLRTVALKSVISDTEIERLARAANVLTDGEARDVIP